VTIFVLERYVFFFYYPELDHNLIKHIKLSLFSFFFKKFLKSYIFFPETGLAVIVICALYLHIEIKKKSGIGHFVKT
jgi:hypothetical protein